MRHLVLLLIGFFIGATLAFVAARSLAQRDAWPRGLMAVLQHELGELRRSERAGRCGAADTATHLARIGDLASVIPASLGSDPGQDPHLADYAKALSRAADEARTGGIVDCKGMAPRLRSLADACDACHRDYR